MKEENKNVAGWITVNGHHIPILTGETQDQAIKRFTDNYNKTFNEFGKAKSKEAEKEFNQAHMDSVKSFVKKNYKDYDESKWVKGKDTYGYTNGDLRAVRIRSFWSIYSSKYDMTLAQGSTFDKAKSIFKSYINDQ